MGYTWFVTAVATPKVGVAENYDLTTGFSGGRSVLVKAEPHYKEVMVGREDIDFRARPYFKGWECEVLLIFDVVNTNVHLPIIARLVNRIVSPDWTVQLSLDQGGAILREVYMKRAGSPQPFGGKNKAGCRIQHLLGCKELLDEYPDIDLGTTW